MSDQTLFQGVQSNLGDQKNKSGAIPDKLKELFYIVEKGNLSEVSQILEENEFAEKSLNRVFMRAFNSFNSFSETFRQIIDTLLR